jgi:hypothetical protein
MKVLVCGSRDWPDPQAVWDRVFALPLDTVVITGKAKGADSEARREAHRRGMFFVDVPVEDCHWQRLGRRAGPERNVVMLDLAPDLVIAFQHNESSGTQGTIDEARRRGIPVEVFTPNREGMVA